MSCSHMMSLLRTTGDVFNDHSGNEAILHNHLISCLTTTLFSDKAANPNSGHWVRSKVLFLEKILQQI